MKTKNHEILAILLATLGLFIFLSLWDIFAEVTIQIDTASP